jgi:chloramphenicol-sensitive protein RarD
LHFELTRSVYYALAAYAIWGTFPLYWTLLRGVPTGQVMGHRIVWSSLVLGILVVATRRIQTIRSASRRALRLYSAAAVLIGINWTIYVWAVTSGFVVETSLGYFITPLVNVLLGVAVLGERLRRLQWLAVAVAAAGVVQLARVSSAPPWIALGLAASFGSYGLIKKRAPMPPVEGLFVETLVLAAPALAYLFIAHRVGAGVFLENHFIDAVLLGTGVLTVIPLLLFASAVRGVSLSAMGILQFFSPTMQFLIGVFVMREPFSAAQLAGFALVWTAIGLFMADGLFTRRVAPVLDEGAA